jgi:hypothetical protein
MHDQAGRLVHDQRGVVFVRDPQRDLLGQQVFVRWGRQLDLDPFAAPQAVRCPAAAAVDARPSIRDEALGMRAADAGHAADRQVESTRHRHAVHDPRRRGDVAHARASPRRGSSSIR